MTFADGWTMRSRTDILTIFSTFVQFTGDRFDSWVANPRLAKNMQQTLLQNADPTHSEDFWTLHWYRLWHRHPLASGHLWAYLQDPCYAAAEQVTRRFTMVYCSLADGFQIAIANAERILNGYNPDYGSNLKAYARTAFGNCIRDQLRQQQEVNISSDWGLLRRLSQTQLTQALLTAGFIQTETPILIWQCFKAICIPEPGRTSRGLSAPSQAQLVAIGNRFRLHCYQSKNPGASAEFASCDVEPEQLLAQLIQLATIARSYLTPTITSLNQPYYDDSSEDQLYTLPAVETPMTQLLAAEAYAEQQARMQQIGIVLEDAISALDIP
ncbi:MAG: sigma-70 family RNA polymerase sigma factor, partial [Symploca sp. SIO2G7]|nr:sigma-70 family RNA polymerase sigma factor [Symploca sp. SIO2G7]